MGIDKQKISSEVKNKTLKNVMVLKAADHKSRFLNARWKKVDK